MQFYLLIDYFLISSESFEKLKKSLLIMPRFKVGSGIWPNNQSGSTTLLYSDCLASEKRIRNFGKTSFFVSFAFVVIKQTERGSFYQLIVRLNTRQNPHISAGKLGLSSLVGFP